MISHSALQTRRSQMQDEALPGLLQIGLGPIAKGSGAAPHAPSSYSMLSTAFRQCARESIKPNESLFDEGDELDSIFAIDSGCIRLQRILGDGGRAIVAFLFEGELVSEFAGGQHRFAAEAVTPLVVRRLALGALRKQLVQTPTLHDELFALGCSQLVNSMEHSVVLARLSAHGRVAAFLLWFAERCQRKAVPTQIIDLPMSRLDIADFLGLTIESVSRAMTRLKGDGLIAIPNIHTVVLKDVTTLRILAGIEET